MGEEPPIGIQFGCITQQAKKIHIAPLFQIGYKPAKKQEVAFCLHELHPCLGREPVVEERAYGHDPYPVFEVVRHGVGGAKGRGRVVVIRTGARAAEEQKRQLLARFVFQETTRMSTPARLWPP